jgi:hypothetical protein
MFGIFKPKPLKKLTKKYNALLEEAMQAQRNGDIKLYSALATEADNTYKKIQSLETASNL